MNNLEPEEHMIERITNSRSRSAWRDELRALVTFSGMLFASLPAVTQLGGDPAALRHLPGVAVIAEDTSPEASACGVTEDWLRERVSSSLRKAGLPRLERSDALSRDQQPMLVVRLQTVKLPRSKTLAWYLWLGVLQRTATLGAPPDTVLAETWAATGTLGVTSGSLLKHSVGETVDQKTDEFAEAWRSRGR
jgi:hypothetical protein